MDRTAPFLKNCALPFLFVIGAIMLWLPQASLQKPSAAGTPHHVHIAFGFHVNLYHSFRGDSNDENGFGQDIRVIRHIIGEMDRFNRAGIPVSAVWDFDNLFSLQEILPIHAPDIIRAVQRRVMENRDDVILMSYNNGLVTAMDHTEFMASMQRAISNAHGSGVMDIFGRMAPVVRPQEMMTTPGNFERYRSLGIDYISLYYSATPFDAFRMFSRELTPSEAYNPVHYRNPQTGEQIVIIPTYHPGDLVDHVSLRNWAEELHRLQNEGKIDRDVLIFINFDADAEFWSGKDFPWHLKWLPNTGGISQLVDSVADLDFVSFTRLTDYLETHPPAGTIHFGQDTADGSFHGYNSWAEKAYVSQYWTRIVLNRRAHEMARKIFAVNGPYAMPPELLDLQQRSFETRLRALSTTNFGLASPFLTRQREAVMASLLDRLDGYTDRIQAHIGSRADTLIRQVAPPSLPAGQGQLVETFLHLNRDLPGKTNAERFLAMTLPAESSNGGRYFLADPTGRIIPVDVVNRPGHSDGQPVPMTFRVSKRHKMPDGPYFLYLDTRSPGVRSAEDRTVYADTRILANEFMSVQFGETGHITGVAQGGASQLDAESLLPYIRYRGLRLSPGKLTITVEQTGADGVGAIRIHGVWDGPKGSTRAPGWLNYRLRLMRGIPYLFIDGEVQYPDTYRRTVIQPEKPVLARMIDAGWEEAAPAELRFSARTRKEQPFFIHKRNYLGREDAYAVDYFRHAPQNMNVASINNHITSEYAGVTTAGRGMAVAMNTDVNANFAFCPFKMEYFPETGQLAIRANPFGTYHGDQIQPPTGGNRLGYEAVLLAAPQFRSAAPTYNGYRERFELMVSFFDGNDIPATVKQDLIAFANRPMLAGTHRSVSPEITSPPIMPPVGFLALPYETGILCHWECPRESDTEYRIYIKSLPGTQEKSFPATGTTRYIEASDFPEGGGNFAAAIEAIYPDGQKSQRSPEILIPSAQQTDPPREIPDSFKARMIWANVNAWIVRNLN